MASEYTKNFNLDLYTDNDKPNLRDQYKAAMEKIDSELQKKTNDITSVEVLIENEVTARKNAISNIDGEIANETSAREEAVSKLTTDLAAETDARTKADTKLTTDLAAETDARTKADTKLTTDLAAETDARTKADTAINAELALLKNLDDIVIEDIKDSDYNTKWFTNPTSTGQFERKDLELNAVSIYHKKDKFGILCGTVKFSIQNQFTFDANAEMGIFKIPNLHFIESEPYHFSVNNFITLNNVVRFSGKNETKEGVVSILNWTGKSETIQAGWSRCNFCVPFTLYE